MSEALFEWKLKRLVDAIEKLFPTYKTEHIQHDPEFCNEVEYWNMLRLEMHLAKEALRDYGKPNNR